MKSIYEYSLAMMYQGEEILSGKIQQFFSGLPKNFVGKIDRYLREGACEKGKLRYDFYDNGEDISINIGSLSNASKDYMNLTLSKVTVADLMCWPRNEGERLIGSFTVYMYGEGSKSKPIRVTYEYHVKKVNGKVLMKISTPKFLSFTEENQALLEKYGLKEADEQAKSKLYEVDLTKILNKNNR